MKINLLVKFSLLLTIALVNNADAMQKKHNHKASQHAPIGVMGDHTHKKGEFMLSYRHMTMGMKGNNIDDSSATNADILATSNRFFGRPMQPAGLRVIPTKMSMDMDMIGAMYAPINGLTLMAMGSYVQKDMDHLTFNPMGNAHIGGFNTKTSGWGDTKLSALIDIHEVDKHHVHVKAGVSLPTGSIDEEDTILAPNGSTPKVRLPYAMQLGTGTYDLILGATYTGHEGDINWGAQYNGEVRLGNNHENYTIGDKHSLTSWAGYDWSKQVNTAIRLTASTQDKISGMDSKIVAPVQTANPDNYGGETVQLGLGVNLLGASQYTKGHRLAAELDMPVYQNLNGPQMETDYTLTIGWQKSF